MVKARSYALALVLAMAALLRFDITGHSAPPQSDVWTAAGSLAQARSGARAVLLMDGRVVTTGGVGAAGSVESVEIAGADGVFAAGPAMSEPRARHTMVLLADGRVLVAGGVGAGGSASATAEVYDPAANAWTPVGSMTAARFGHTATLLADGRVLIAGGEDGSSVLATLELFTPETAEFTSAGTLTTPRRNHAAAVGGDGRVLIIGGSDGTDVLSSVDAYDVMQGTVSSGPALAGPREGHTATALIDGRIFVVGGSDGASDLTTGEVADGVGGAFQAVAAPFVPRRDHAALLLPHNNRVLIAGGDAPGGVLASTEIFIPWTGDVTTALPMTGARANAALVSTTAIGVVAAVGGRDGAGPIGTAETFRFPTVLTDKDDYEPGEMVTITGSGWEPGETVTLVLQELPSTHGPTVLSATANDEGNILNTAFSPDEHDRGVRFYLTATGVRSQAQMTFTDHFGLTATALSTTSVQLTWQNTDTGVSRAAWYYPPPSGPWTYRTNVVSNGGTQNFTMTGLSACSTYHFAVGGVNDGHNHNGDPGWFIYAFNVPTLCANPTKLAFTNSPFTIVNGQCSPALVVQSQDPFNRAVSSGAPRTVTLSSSSSGSYYSNSTCSTAIGSTTIPGGGHTTPAFYYKPAVAGTVQLNASTAGLTSAVQNNGVNRASTSTTISAHTPNPSNFNQQVAVTVSVAVLAPGSGTATGNITVSMDGNTCTIAAPSGTCNVTPPTAGNRTITATYPLTSNFSGSSAAVAHSVLQGTPTVTWNAPAAITYGTALSSTQLNATASVPGTFAYTPASGTVLAAGSQTLSVTFTPTNLVNYTVVTTTVPLTVNPATLTVTGRSVSRPYGSANPDISTPLSVTGFVNGDTSAVVTTPPTCSTTATAASPVGSYPVTCTGGSAANYTFSHVAGSLTVTPVQLTVAAQSASRPYGSANPDLSAPATVTGFVLGETSAVLTAQPTCSTAATSSSPVASYPVTCSGAAATNYTFTYVPGSLTVTRVQLTVTGQSTNRPYGSANPDLSAPMPITGFVLGETSAVLTTQPTCSTAATPASPVGSYPVTCAGGVATNYSFAYVAGSLTVDAVELTVTAKSANRPYGSMNPDLSAPLSITGFVLGETSAVITTQPACSTTATADSPVGTYPVTCSGAAAANYTFTYVPGTLSVDAVQLTVTAKSANRPYAAANPDVSAPLSITGFVTGETAAVFTAQPSCTTAATPGSPVGSYPVTCSGAAAANYTFAYVPGTLAVDAVQLTVTAPSANRAYGAANPDLSSPLSVTGFVAGETAAVLGTQPTCGTSATPASPIGSYPVICSGATATNYTFAYVPGTLTVDAVQLTVTAQSASRPYGAANPDLSAPLSITGFVAGETAAVLTTQPSCATTATPASPIGSYPVVCSGGVATNYTFTYAPGALTVDAVQITVTAQSASRPYGSSNPDLSAPLSMSGFVLSDNPGVLTTQPACSTTATSASPVGTYPVTCSGGAAANYTFAYVPGSLAVTAVQLTVTAQSATRAYGAANPDLSAPSSITGFVAGETAAVLNTQPSCSTSATPASPVGTYPVVCTGGADDNYTFAYASGTLTVDAVQLTVTAQSATRPYGAPNPDLSAPLSITGFVGGETPAVLTTQPACGTAATPASAVGSHPVTCSGAAATNYTFAYQPGVLTVSAVQLVVTAQSASRPYGAPNPDLSAPLSITGFVAGETAGVLSAQPTCGTSATPSTAIGPYPVICGGGAATNYTFAYAPGSLTVTSVQLTVTAQSANRPYGAANPDLSAPLSITGFVGGETAAVLLAQPTCDTAATPASSVGSYPVTCSGGGATNYTFAYLAGTLTVDAVQLTVTAQSVNRPYGAANPDVSAPLSITGFVSGQTAAVLNTQPSCSTGATPASPVGSYPIVCAGGADDNYTFAYSDGTLTVDPVQLTVTAQSASRPYGAPNPDLAAPLSITGFVAGENAAALSTQPSCVTAATPLSPVASYPVDCSGAAAANYTFTYTPGTLTVQAVQLTVTGQSASRSYGAPNPDLSAPLSVTGFVPGETAAVLTSQPTCSTAATQSSPIGTYAVTCTGGAATNYTFTYPSGTLTIDAIQLTVTARSANRLYGGANPDVSTPLSITGFIPGETAAVLTTQPSCSTTATSSSPIGPYQVTCDGAAATNYTFAYLPGTLIVDPVQLTVTAQTVSRTYGLPNPDVSAPLSITGFVLGETGAVLSVQPACSTTATQASGIGPYPVTCGGAAAANYTFAYVPGTLNVTRAPLTVTANSLSRQYSDPTPPLTYVISGFMNGDTASVVSGAAGISTTATQFSPVGTYPITPTIGSLTAANYSFTNFVNGVLSVLKEDAFATYTGLTYVSTASATSSTALVTLRATIQDITAVSPGVDGNPGNITTATVQFVNRDAASAPLCTATLTLVSASDPKTANASCTYTFNIGAADSDSIAIGIVVNGNYARNSGADDSVITISKPLTAFITGGGYLIVQSSAGVYAGTAGTKANFGFNAKAKGKNVLQGKVNVIIRKDGRVYQIKSTAIDSLTSRAWTTTAPGIGSFQSKGAIQDVTDPLAPISLGGNLTIQMTFTDKGEPGSTDTLALTVWDGGTLLFSSRWNGVSTVEQLLAGGNVVAR